MVAKLKVLFYKTVCSRSGGASINLRPDPAQDSIAKILEFKVCAVKVEAVSYENADK